MDRDVEKRLDRGDVRRRMERQLRGTKPPAPSDGHRQEELIGEIFADRNPGVDERRERIDRGTRDALGGMAFATMLRA